MGRSYLVTERMSVGYDGVPLIRDISIEIRQGEIVTLVGPNGSGKSTILKSITRQLRTLSGRVLVAGEELTHMGRRALATRMAVALTDRARPELTTCRDVVAVGRYPYTGRLGVLTPRDEAKVDEAMAAVRVAELAERDFNAISDGQRQRVLLARAICQEPEIIVLDEPTSFLDVRHKLELLGILRRMAVDQGIAVVLSLHEIDLAQKISDRVICVKGETLFGAGTPEEVFREDVVRRLFDIGPGGYDPLFGAVELPKPPGEPEVFVLSNCGSGIPVYRALQRAGTPFAAGILYENDVDCRVARLLAAEVVTEAPFRPIGDVALARALMLMERCGRVVNAGVTLGETNRRLAELVARAEALEGR